jgi:hypothetical protein
MKRTFQQRLTWANWRCWAVLLAVAGIVPAHATDSLFQNISSSYYLVPGAPPPAFDVTAFDNENTFSVGYSVYSPYPLLYETWNTVNYTNNSVMIANSPFSTNGLTFGSSFGCGFNFDLQTTSQSTPHARAGTFYNPGIIRCNSTNDSNGIFTFGGFTFFFVNSIGQCLVNASNIINSGVIDVGADGLIKLNARWADLSLATIYLEQPLTAGFLLGGGAFTTSQTLANISASGSLGTNLVWSPRFNLTATTALSPPPFQIYLTNSTPYVDVRDVGNSNIIVRSVFIYDSNPNIPRKVYFGNTPSDPLGNGGVTVEWDGIYQDPASGQFLTNYLYLNNDYIRGSSTNVFIFNGVPDNFTFTESTTPYVPGVLATSGFSFAFQPASGITNLYSAVTANLLSSTVPTNASAWNPSGALSNLPGKIFISASDELTLAGAQIGGENYLNLSAPKQFDGSQGAFITAPYADINLGVTNGVMQLANLIANGVGSVSGTVQAWSTRWIYNDPSGTNYDFRAMIVTTSLAAQSQSWIQTLALHATNSLVINDVLNVFKSLSIDAQRLTIATNGYGNGFTSAAGAINWANNTTFGPTQIPNVLWLTNNGTITALNNAIFGTSALRYAAFINSGGLSDQGTVIWTTNFQNGGSITNGTGAFTLQTLRAVMTNGAVYAGGTMSLISSNSIYITNEVLVAGHSLNLYTVSNLTDGVTPGPQGVTGNFWSVGASGFTGEGVFLLVKPQTGDLLGTTITNYAPSSKVMQFQWAGQNRGYSLAGFSNNAALGRLVLDGSAANSKFNFTGASTSNALYVDSIEIKDASTNLDANGNVLGVTFNTNLVIYFAQAIRNGQFFAEKLNLKNTNNLVNDATSHFRWVPQYVGYFSGTNLVYPDGTTNFVNAALAQSFNYDSDKDGIPNGSDLTPFFVTSQINFSLAMTNVPLAGKRSRLSWWSIPSATNMVQFKTNLLSPAWSVLTNFVTPPPAVGPATNLIVLDPAVTNAARFYRICVTPQFP